VASDSSCGVIDGVQAAHYYHPIFAVVFDLFHGEGAPGDAGIDGWLTHYPTEPGERQGFSGISSNCDQIVPE
jgi:hypothetical protein